MNLWAKRTGQLLFGAVLFFLLSCEDDSFLLGFKGNTKFEGRYQEIPWNNTNSSMLLLDSIATDQYDISTDNFFAYRFLLGEVNDPAFGVIRSEVFAQFQPDNSPANPPYFNSDRAILTYDSTTVQLQLDRYLYGPEVSFNEKVTVYELAEKDSLSFFVRYFNNTPHDYNPIPLGELKFIKGWNQYKNEIAADTARFYLRGRLDDEYGFRIFSYAGSKGDTALVGDNLQGFRDQFFGLAFIPTESDRIAGYSVTLLSKLTLHYHTSANKKLTTDFYFYPYPYVSSNSYSKITTNRIGDLAGISTPNEPYNVSGQRYIQDGSVVVPNFELADYYSFIDTLENVVINSAEISLGVEPRPDGMPPPQNLYVVLSKKTSDNKVIAIDSTDTKTTDFEWISANTNVFTDLTNYSVSTELSSLQPLILTYDPNTQRYYGYATLFFQTLFNSKDEVERRLESITLLPVTAPTQRAITSVRKVNVLRGGMGNTVNGAVLKSNDMKLKLYYTTPNLPNLD
jgi:Domain of unknown function (DUF4270)